MTRFSRVVGVLGLAAVALALGPGAHAAPVYAEVSNVAELLQAAQSVTGDGGQIILRPGSYELTAPLKFKSVYSLELRGSGWSTVLRTPSDGLIFEDCAFCSVRDLLIVGDLAGKSGSGIIFRGQCSSNTVDFCRLASFPDSGLAYEGDPVVPQSSNTVMRCHFIDNGGAQLLSRNNNDFFMMQNQFGADQRHGDGAPQCGTLLDHSSAGTYSTSYHWGNRVALKMTGGCHFNRIENNRFEMSLEQGLLMGSQGSGELLMLNIITGNTIHTNSMAKSGASAAVEAYDAWSTTFCTNQIFSWDSASFKHRKSLVLGLGCQKWIVKDNICGSNTEEAIFMADDAGHIVKDNITD